MSKEVAISVKDVDKSFRLPHEQHTGLKQFAISAFKRKRVKGYENQRVLKGISFDIEKGEFFGIVGRNGSGKSTLLKLLAGIYTPDNGEIIINGSLVPFIELGVGFNPELTGRENVFLNGALLGFSRKQMEVMYDEIVEFAELERFMDQKLKNYSSGMQVRLAFSIAIRAESDILILDEVLAVGDEAFQRKCYAYFAELKRNKKTVILVTHSMDSVQQFCTKAMMVEAGNIVSIGNPSKVAQCYREAFLPKSAIQKTERKTEKGDGFAENDLIAAKVDIKQSGEKLDVELTIRYKKATEEKPIVAFGFVKSSGEQVYRWASDEKIEGNLDLNAVKLSVQMDNIFPEGDYGVLLVIKSRDRSKDFGTFKDILKFSIMPRTNLKWDTYWKPKESLRIIDKKEKV